MDESRRIDESRFTEEADAALSALADAIEAAGIDADCSFKGDGVLEIDLDAHGKIIVNRHGAAREIWLAARSGGFHFRHDGAHWVDTRDGRELFAAVGQVLSEQSGEAVELSPPA